MLKLTFIILLALVAIIEVQEGAPTGKRRAINSNLTGNLVNTSSTHHTTTKVPVKYTKNGTRPTRRSTTEYPYILRTFSQEIYDYFRRNTPTKPVRTPLFPPRTTTRQDYYENAGEQLVSFFYPYRRNAIPWEFKRAMTKCKNETDSIHYSCYAKCVTLKMGFFITGRGLQTYEIMKMLRQINPIVEIDMVEAKQLQEITEDLELCGRKWPEQISDYDCKNQPDFWTCVKDVFVERLDIVGRTARIRAEHKRLGIRPATVIH